MRSVGYRDAVTLLAPERSLLAGLDRALGGALLGATVATGGLASPVLSLFDVKGEVLRLAGPLLGRLSDRLAGTTRYDRTQRLLAAHTVLVVTAFFEAFDELDLPFDTDRLHLTRAERHRAAEPRQPGQAEAGDLDLLLGDGDLAGFPGLAAAHRPRFAAMGRRLTGFVQGLAVWDELTDTQRAEVLSRCGDPLAERAGDRYAELYRRLAVDVPEFGFWAAQLDHEHTRAEVRRLGHSLSDLAELLRRVPGGRAPDERRAALARAYQAQLGRPALTDRDLPDGLRMPTLGEAYLDPHFRLLTVTGQSADEDAWSCCEVRADLPRFFAGYLTGPAATEAPLLVLGQPGAGKSVLTQVLAARLPAADFLPIRVVLRSVRADVELQAQIEDAIYAATGDHVGWPELVRSAGDALPVVLLDGFDELLQATGVNQADYLERVARFQAREAEQGRPVAVLVTSRTAVAARVRYPAGTTLVRLEPFGAAHVTEWLAVWHRVNDAHFAGGIRALTADVALRYRQLSTQPLLLQMLALYDAEGNALRHADADGIDEAGLYERLLATFARREVRKRGESLPDEQLAARTEQELQRLSLVAFAMFNRGRQWVTAAELDADLAALGVHTDEVPATGFRAPLTAADRVLGRFFFIQRSVARRSTEHLETYEFLHATFGEYLIARLISELVSTLLTRRSALHLASRSTVDDDVLWALLSFVSMCDQENVLPFLIARLGASDRQEMRAALVLALNGDDDRPRGYGDYRPVPRALVARLAIYRANLMLLVLATSGTVRAGELWPDEEPRRAWRHHALQWQSSLSFGAFRRFTGAVTVEQIRHEGRSDLRLSLEHLPLPGRSPGRPRTAHDLNWHLDRERGSTPVRANFGDWPSALRNLGFTADLHSDIARQTLAPLVRLTGESWAIRGPYGQLIPLAQPLIALALADRSGSTRGDLPALYRAVLSAVPSVLAGPRVRVLLLGWLARDAHGLDDRLCREVLAAVAPDLRGDGARGSAAFAAAVEAIARGRELSAVWRVLSAGPVAALLAADPGPLRLRIWIALHEAGAGVEDDEAAEFLGSLDPASFTGEDQHVLRRAGWLFRSAHPGTPLPWPDPAAGGTPSAGLVDLLLGRRSHVSRGS